MPEIFILRGSLGAQPAPQGDTFCLMGIVQGYQLSGLGLLGSPRQVGKTPAHVDELRSFPSQCLGPAWAITYVFAPDLLLGQLYLDEGSHGGEELPPGPVLHSFVLLDVLLHAANGQVLDLGGCGVGGTEQGSQAQAKLGSAPPPAPWLGCSSGHQTRVKLSLCHPCPQPPSIPQGVGGREPGPGSTALGTNCSTVIRNNFICFICCLIISSTLA